MSQLVVGRVLGAMTLVAIAACGGTSAGYPGFGDASVGVTSVTAGDDSGGNSGSSGGGGSSSGDDGSGMCSASCHTNQDCQTSCPAPSGSASCCDVGSTLCMIVSGSTCPSMPEAGTD